DLWSGSSSGRGVRADARRRGRAARAHRPARGAATMRRHILNSAAVGSLLPASGTVADVGSGAGLPGIVLAIMRPDLEFDLIEPMERRADWLAEVIEALDLDNVTIHQVRAEELHKKRTYDVVTARAVAGMDKLLRFTVPLIGAGGRLL